MKVIVLMVRGCPAGWLGCYGNEWVVTPHLDRLAAESVVFDRHISDQPSPDGADIALLGLNRSPGLLERLRQHGVLTALVRANHPETDRPETFYAGWHRVFDARPQQEDPSPLDALIRDLPACLADLATHPAYLLWVEIDRLLPPWEIPQAVFDAYFWEDEAVNAEAGSDSSNGAGKGDLSDDVPKTDEEVTASGPPRETIPPWRDPPVGTFDSSDADAVAWLQASFASVVTCLDEELGRLLDILREQGLGETAAWVLTSDYGFPLGEHGQIGLYRPWLHEELVHLPLMVRLPGAAEACRRVYAFTQPPDLAATLAEWFRCPPTDGHSLLPLLRGQMETIRTRAVTRLAWNGAEEWALRTDDWAFLLPVRVPEGESRPPLLFQKPDDRWEVNDLRVRHLELADALATELRGTMAPRGPEPGVTAEQL